MISDVIVYVFISRPFRIMYPASLSPALLMYAGSARVTVPRVCRVPVGGTNGAPPPVNFPYFISTISFFIFYRRVISRSKLSFPRKVVSLTIR